MEMEIVKKEFKGSGISKKYIAFSAQDEGFEYVGILQNANVDINATLTPILKKLSEKV